MVLLAQSTTKDYIRAENKLSKVPWFNIVSKQAVKEHKKAEQKLF